MQNAIVLHPHLKLERVNDLRDSESKLEEAVGLAMAIDLNILLAQTIALQKIIPSTFIGTGKLEEIKNFIADNEVDVVIVNENISPIQQRNLEKALDCKVIDRTALILEIFGQRASTKEGKLQVELAAFEYQKSRLVRSWTHLERQRGGGGFMGGPGEKQIESDRRALRERIASIKKQLKKVVQTRSIQRDSRKKIPYEIVALVGYTNAGKSTLFNKITGAEVLAKDQLFATLDPTMRIVKLPSGKKIIMSDTVGFISDLPTELVAAFRATLEEVIEANVILHVMDASNEHYNEQKKDVIGVLAKLGISEKAEENIIDVYNKMDLLSDDIAQKYEKESSSALISAITGEGIDDLLKRIDAKLAEGNKITTVKISVENGKANAWLHANADILKQTASDDKITYKISISVKNLGILQKML